MDYVINRPAFNTRYRQRSRMRSMLRKWGRICSYCGRETTRDLGHNHPQAPSRDHIIPLSRGGADSLDNLTLACRECNESKGSLDAEEFSAWREGLASRLDIKNPPKRHKPLNVWDDGKREWKPNPLNEVVSIPITKMRCAGFTRPTCEPCPVIVGLEMTTYDSMGQEISAVLCNVCRGRLLSGPKIAWG